MNILVCDDQLEEVLKFKETIEQLNSNTNISIFQSGEEVVSYINSGVRVDICFLDIIMPSLDGIATATQLRENGYWGDIVFITNSNDFAAESYRVKAFSYLLKPIDIDLLADVLARCRERLTKENSNGLPIKTGSFSKFLMFKNISHVEVIRHQVYFRLTDGDEIRVFATFSEFLPKLFEDGRFAQCHRSFVVNMDEVSSIQGNSVILNCGKSIPISRTYSNFKKRYLDWNFYDRGSYCIKPPKT